MEKENYYSETIAKLSDSELRNYIENKDKFEEDAVLAALWELERRKKTNDKEVHEIKSQIENIKEQKKQEIELKKKRSNYTDDPNAPELYPRWSILLISILYTPLFGGILLSINFRKIDLRKYVGIVLAFSIIYTIFVGFVANTYSVVNGSSMNVTYFLNLIGTIILDQYFWNKKIGKELKYRKRSVLIPFIIFTVIAAIMIWAMILSI